MSVVGQIAAKKLQGQECSEVFSLQQNRASSFDQVVHAEGHPPFRLTKFIELAGRPIPA
jgi:hypothetical protein